MATKIIQERIILRVVKVPLYLPTQRKPPSVQSLQSALASFSKTLEVSHQSNGQPIPATNTAGTLPASTSSGELSPGTGTAMIAVSPSSETGVALGRIGAIERPRTAEEAAKLAERLVGDLLPPSVVSWLAAEEAKIRTGMEVFPRVPKPEATAELTTVVSTALKSLSEVMEPAGKRRPELAVEIAKLFAAFNLYTGDTAKSVAQVEVWGEQLAEFPLYAIRKAARWAIRGDQKMPSLAAFITNVRLATGSHVIGRRLMLQRWASVA